MPTSAQVVPGIATLLILGLSACASAPAATPRPAPSPATSSALPDGSGPAPVPDPVPPPLPDRATPADPGDSTVAAPDGATAPAPQPRMLRATMRIPAIGLGAVPVVPYRGSPDDGPGTEIQDGGVAASPFGARGGVGPGQVGNYLVTAHRTSGGAPFAELPSMRRGEHVLITAGGQVFDYRIVQTRSTSFRSPRSLARQAAAVPGHPGDAPTRAMITLSTCATPEDHAEGNYWADEYGNPEHRIDKVGVLVGVRRG